MEMTIFPQLLEFPQKKKQIIGYCIYLPLDFHYLNYFMIEENYQK